MTRRKPLVWKLFLIYFIITLASVVIVGFYASGALRDFYYSQAEQDLRARLSLIAAEIINLNNKEDPALLASQITHLAKAGDMRITLIDRQGVVIADSRTPASRMENHSDRPEFTKAIMGQAGIQRRTSPTLGVTMVYVAIPLRQEGRIVAVLRGAVAATALDSAPTESYRRTALGVVFIAVFAGAVSLIAVRRISGPLNEMKLAASRYARGDFHSRVPLSDTEEFASLAETLNQMAEQIDAQVHTILQQAEEQKAILSSMKEAVVAIDNSDRILILNPAAERILGVESECVKGKTIQEAIRNPELQKFLVKSRASHSPMSDEFVFHDADERIMQVTGTGLVGANEEQIGALVVINEVTQTRKLENLRRDFVANVSHELKTPITSIKGFVETLREGAIHNPDRATEFLDIIARQSDRLEAIIEDLLALSRIEQGVEAAEIELELMPLRGIIEAAVLDCEAKATSAGVQVCVEVDQKLQAMINEPLLEQAVANLLDNAIKYAPGGAVHIKAQREAEAVAIHVIDTGCGIEPEHISRLFERFYRVDKARSRKMGGTGLGLAIVKHIAQAHHGHIEVNSTPGKGSTFSIILPATPEK